jgi:hypothetical protein
MTNMTEQEFSDWLQEAFKTVGKKLPDDGSLDFDNAYYDNSRPFPAWVVPIHKALASTSSRIES